VWCFLLGRPLFAPVGAPAWFYPTPLGVRVNDSALTVKGLTSGALSHRSSEHQLWQVPSSWEFEWTVGTGTFWDWPAGQPFQT
jgi:hypothetical protein